MSIAITIDDLALPGVAAGDVPRVIAAMEAEFSARFDPARVAATRIDRLAIAPPAGTAPEALGRMLGAELARQLHGGRP